MNKVMLIGYVGKDPDVRYYDADQAVAQFSLATTERGYVLQNGTKVPDHTDWHTVLAWSGIAKIVEKYVHKGDRLYIEGRIRYRSYDDHKGQRRYVTEILAENMGPRVLEMPSFNILFALAIGILFYFLPLLLFKIYGIFREKKAQKEIMLLQTYTLMMLSSGKSVKYILEILLNRSDIYKSSFRKCLQEYSYNPVNAFEILKNDISLPGFTSTVNALEKSLLYDRNMAEEYLRNSRILESNLRKINLQKSNKNKQMTGTVLLILPLIAFCVVCGYPWFVMVLKLMSNLNGL